MKTKREKWELPKYFYDNFEKVGIEYIKVVLDQANKKLAEAVKIGEQTTDKGFKLLTITLTLLTALLIYAVNPKDGQEVYHLAAILSIVLCTLSVSFLTFGVMSYDTYVVGSSPKDLLRENNVRDFDHPTSAINLILSESVNAQERIEHNLRINRKRSRYINYAIYLLVMIPFTLACSFVFFFTAS